MLTQLHWLTLLLLTLTIALGTHRSFSLFSSDTNQAELVVPIHQLTRLPQSYNSNTLKTTTTTTLPYFANKNNLFNQKLVKLGWAWTSLVIWYHAISIASSFVNHHPDQQKRADSTSEDEKSTPNPSHHVPRILSLHLIATIQWILLTQWCFGSSLIERVLILSGAQCIPSIKPSSTVADQPTQLEHTYCQRRWGKPLPGLDQFVMSTYRPYWAEGMDVSGHTFLLTFSILLIVSSLRPSLTHLWLTKRPHLVPRTLRLAIYANLGLLAIWWWMLLMTSFYFHGPLEKFAGLALGSFAWLLSEYVVNRCLG